MKKLIILLLIVLNVAYAKKFLIKKGDIVDGKLNVGIVIAKKPNVNTEFLNPYQEKEPPQVYPISITFSSNILQNCNAIGYLIYNTDFNRFYGSISEISCNENGKIKNYETKGYILNNQAIVGLSELEAQTNTPIKIMFIKEITPK